LLSPTVERIDPFVVIPIKAPLLSKSLVIASSLFWLSSHFDRQVLSPAVFGNRVSISDTCELCEQGLLLRWDVHFYYTYISKLIQINEDQLPYRH